MCILENKIISNLKLYQKNKFKKIYFCKNAAVLIHTANLYVAVCLNRSTYVVVDRGSSVVLCFKPASPWSRVQIPPAAWMMADFKRVI